MKSFMGLALLLLTTGCNPSPPPRANGLGPAATSDVVPSNTYAEAKENLSTSESAREAARNDRSYSGLRASGMSQDSAAEVVSAARELCPHTDAAGNCN